MNTHYPKTKHSVIRNTKLFLNLDDSHIVTYSDVLEFKNYMNKLLYDENMSPTEIARKYNLDKKYNFSLFLSKCLGIDLRSCKEANIRTHKIKNTLITDDKQKYKLSCKFKFSPWKEKKLIGYDLLFKYKFCKAQDRIEGETYIHRDHMISINYGWINGISPEIISHPANCAIIFEKDNIIKNVDCSLTIDQLHDRIRKW